MFCKKITKNYNLLITFWKQFSILKPRVIIENQLQPEVPPQVLHFIQVPFLTKV